MKYFSWIILFSFSILFSQNSLGGTPYSFNNDMRDNAAFILTDDVNHEEMRFQDNSRPSNSPYRYGKKFEHNYIANTHMWDDVAAADAFGGALNKDINITIVTPGLGDTPLWMSKELGSTIAQFKKFAMASTQRMLFRGMQERDLDFLFGSMMLIGSGMMIDGVY